MLNNHENLIYGNLAVCMWHSWQKLAKPNNYFLKGQLVRLWKEAVDFTNEVH